MPSQRHPGLDLLALDRAAHQAALIRLMERASPLCGLTPRDAFRRWLAVVECDLCCPVPSCGRLVPERSCDARQGCASLRRQGWEQRVAGIEPALPLFIEALAHLYAHHTQSYEDLLGPCFEALGLGGHGVFFTPWPVACMLAALIAGDLDDREELRLDDPCCGSGTLLLAFLGHVARERPDRLPQVRVCGQDLNPDCVRMCRISLRILAIVRAERLIDAYAAGDLGAALELEAARLRARASDQDALPVKEG